MSGWRGCRARPCPVIVAYTGGSVRAPRRRRRSGTLRVGAEFPMRGSPNCAADRGAGRKKGFTGQPYGVVVRRPQRRLALRSRGASRRAQLRVRGCRERAARAGERCGGCGVRVVMTPRSIRPRTARPRPANRPPTLRENTLMRRQEPCYTGVWTSVSSGPSTWWATTERPASSRETAEKALLAALALRPGMVVSSDQLVDETGARPRAADGESSPCRTASRRSGRRSGPTSS